MMNKTKDIFISRHLVEDSMLLNHFDHNEITYDHRSLINFEAVAFDKPWSEWLFFYSKKGVKYYFDQLAVQKLRSHKLACFGPGTASYLLDNYGFMPDFIGTGEKTSTSDLLIEMISSESVCFIVGKNSIRSVQELLDNHIESVEICVYNNTPKTNVQLGHYGAAILTSPMNYEAFVNNGGSSDTIISIGETTSNKIKEIDPIALIHQSDEPSEMSILKTLTAISTN